MRGLTEDALRKVFASRVRRELDRAGPRFRYRSRFVELERPKGARCATRELVIEKSLDGGVEWLLMSMDLTLRSRVVLLTAAAPYWPPEHIIDLGCSESGPWFEYFDSPDEFPPWARAHALWRAEFVPEKNQWEIRRLRPLRSEDLG